jgi:peptidoglycan-N-acetylglucosamine deacetylase
MISVVIPAYNEEKYLPGCLESLRAQHYKEEYEIIVADNGSSDGTAQIAMKFGARVVTCPEKKSVFYARQVGADAASGDIIVQADADTVYPGQWLSRIVAQFAAHPEVVGITGHYRYINPPGWAGWEYLLRRSVNLFTIVVWRRPLWVSGATFAFRRQAFCEGNGYHDLTYSPDQYGISTRLSRLGRVIFDKDLCVLTSSRTVQKPLFFIVMDFRHHLGRWLGLSIKNHLARLKRLATGKPARNTSDVSVRNEIAP